MIGAAKAGLKRAAGLLVAEYRINWIYAGSTADGGEPADTVQPVDKAVCEQLARSPTLQMRKAAAYANSGLAGLALIDGGVPVCVAHFATPAQYQRTGTWPLASGEAALMDIATEDAQRGKGYAVRLIRQATTHFRAAGHDRLIAFIWWSNQPSIRAFTKAGWRRIGISVELRRADRWRALRIGL